MKVSLDLKDLSPRQRQAWEMRYGHGWRMTRIALELGVSQPAVSKLIKRAERRLGLFRTGRVRIMRTKPRKIRVASLSRCFNY